MTRLYAGAILATLGDGVNINFQFICGQRSVVAAACSRRRSESELHFSEFAGDPRLRQAPAWQTRLLLQARYIAIGALINGCDSFAGKNFANMASGPSIT
jgi:hypothetical protein